MEEKKISRDWFRRSVIYQVFIDRFNGAITGKNRASFLGGTLGGVTEKLDYLQKLGISIIWLSPFYRSSSYHGYHITDFGKVDPHFGTAGDLKELIRSARERGIRILADFVPNHCSVRHPFFKDAIRNRDSRYRDWFLFTEWPDRYLSFLGFRELPKLNLRNPEVAAYITGMADFWLSEGLDGYRLDHVIGPPHAFWRKFTATIRTKHPGAVLFGEAWAQGLENRHFKTVGFRHKPWRRLFGISQENIQLEYSRVMDGALDFFLRDLMIGAVRQGSGLKDDHRLHRRISKHLEKVPRDYHMVTFLDNHDTDRFIRFCNGDVGLLLSAFEVLMQLDHPVVLYTGTEMCRANAQEVTPLNAHSDLQVREPLDWGALNGSFVEGFAALVRKYR